MNKKTLTLTLAVASIVVTCAQVCADIRIEAAGLPTTSLKSCPEKKPLLCTQFFQYKVFSHFSNLTLGDTRKPSHEDEKNYVILKPTAKGAKTNSPVKTTSKPLLTAKKTKVWNRLSVSAGNQHFPLDIFKSSTRTHASTGTVLNRCPIWNLSAQDQQPTISIEGNTHNPQGLIVLCVDFIPTPPHPKGSLSLQRSGTRNGEKAPLAWKINR